MRGLASLIILASALIVTSVYSQDSTQLKGPKGVDYGVQGRAIGPIKPTDTLWRIAVKVRPDNSVSIYQVMQALYNKNPNSFLEQNLNHMQSGAYLNIPTLAEIKSVSSELARQRSEQDDKLWEKKKNGTLTQSEINTAQTKVTQARKVDVDEAKKELQKELNDIKTDQSNRLVELQQQFKSSVNNVEEMLVENNKLKKQLTGISQELKNLREQLGQDSEIQLQLKELIVKQNEIIAQQKIKDAKQDAEFDLGALLSNPLVLILLMTIPALLIIFAVVMLLRKRANNTEQNNQEDEEFLPQTPVYSSDDSDDVVSAASHDDPIIPDPLDDLSVQLDDGIADDALLDDDVAFDDSLDDSNLLDQDELESLLSDDIIFDDEDGQDDDELDIFMQQGFDEPADDSLEDTIDLDLNTSQNSDDILSADDLDSLFDEDDSLPEIESSDSDKVAPESGDSHDEISAFSEELASEDDDFDIDDLLESEQSSIPSNTEELVEENDDFDLDDIDSLIDEVSEQDDALPEKQSSATELVEENDDFDLDDIDSLIDEANVQGDDLLEEQNSATELVEENDDFDLDDIDSLIDEASEQGDVLLEEQNSATELVEENDDFDLDDIDSLIDEVSEQSDEKQPETPLEEQNNTAELVEETDDFDLDDIDDIDSLIDEVSEQSEQGDEEQPEAPLEEQNNTAELVEETDDFDLDEIDDIDSLIDNLDDDLDEHDAQIDTALAESVEDLEKAQQELNSDDAESVASSFSENTESALESESELAVEEQDDFGDSIIEDYSDTSQTLLDPEDALEEYNDDNLKSIDELLNELQQASDDEEYVEPPQWSVDDFNDVTEAELGDDPLGIENDESELLADESVPDVAAPSEELDVDEYPELDLNDDAILTADEQQAFTPQELQGDNLDGDAKGMASSQAEQDLANSLLAGGNLDSLNDDFDDELLIENDFSELDSEQQNEDELLAITSPPEVDTSNSSEQQLNDDVSDDLLNEVDDIQIEQLNEELDEKLIDEQTNVDREAALMPTELPHNGEVASDEELDDEFMADLTQTDFDALLNELADADELDIADSSEFDVDFNNLLSDEIDTDESALAPQPTVNSNTIEQTSKDEFVDIDALLEQSDDADTEHEPYDDVNMDVGLGDFDSLLAGDNPTDVDAESGGYSAKLDLARAYIEIDDFDSALKVIEDVINKGPEEVQQEALSLKAKLK
ncbi:FimV/HubP family polar landmark protein [Pseudoalteromonas sp. JB197]|uniref:FimV/HubP family polar landmark protein n=1 Tax=Pseudoalteromonas sp. JB197 TaxID=1434839 RepID=UPI00097E93E3|nr:FimV/HubP family polar landmark protein [Pseudoalteromonas sp. JB197]SJN48396.1 Signal recognition particle receptor protein FtsY (=alpha subunit) (TC 3.A.5.1.1) [Pseudoalteromonas sp. JB197]